jgi:protein-disulfide isomerase
MALRQNIETATSAIIALCALAVTLSVVRGQFFPQTAGIEPLQRTREQDWQQYSRSSMRIGPASARVTITEFSDFQCPACYRLYRSLASARARNGNSVTIAYRNYPLNELHPFAKPAAMAAQCAADQGRFTEYHDFLFEHQDSLGTIRWTQLAARLGIADTVAFARCLTATTTLAKLRRDSADAAALGIAGTPLVLINEWLYRGNPGQPVLDSAIGRATDTPRR